MAKALLGHLGYAPDQRTVAEMARLRSRVAELEGELRRARAAYADLLHTGAVADSMSKRRGADVRRFAEQLDDRALNDRDLDDRPLDDREPALT